MTSFSSVDRKTGIKRGRASKPKQSNLDGPLVTMIEKEKLTNR